MRNFKIYEKIGANSVRGVEEREVDDSRDEMFVMDRDGYVFCVAHVGYGNHAVTGISTEYDNNSSYRYELV